MMKSLLGRDSDIPRLKSFKLVKCLFLAIHVSFHIKNLFIVIKVSAKSKEKKISTLATY